MYHPTICLIRNIHANDLSIEIWAWDTFNYESNLVAYVAVFSPNDKMIYTSARWLSNQTTVYNALISIY